MKKVSFCITCKDRFQQVSRTLPVNLADNLADKEDIEFVLVDFGSGDGLREWVLANFREELKVGYLKYLYTESLPFWHMSVAKNTAHYFSRGDIVVNLDGDNYTGIRGGAFVMKQFDKFGHALLMHQFSGKWSDGSCGRIGIRREFFLKVGGYDESFLPMGYEDVDFLRRLHFFGLDYELIRDPRYNRAIPNTKRDSLKNTGSALSLKKMNEHNRFRSKLNIDAGRIIISEEKIGVREGIFQFDGNAFIQVI